MKLNQDNYYSQSANTEYYSVSQIKQFLDCPARAMAELRGEYQREKTDAILLGGFVDAWFSEETDRFCMDNPEIFKKNGELRSEIKRGYDIIDRLCQDELIEMMMHGDKQKIETGEIDGFPFKAKLDFLLSDTLCGNVLDKFPNMTDLLFASGAIVDLKIVKDFNPVYKEDAGRLNFIEYWQYDMQLAVYQELVRQRTGERFPCYIVAATKERVPDIGLFRIPQSEMDVSLELMREKLPHIDKIKRGEIEPERCEKCEYCRRTRVLTGATWFDEF